VRSGRGEFDTRRVMMISSQMGVPDTSFVCPRPRSEEYLTTKTSDSGFGVSREGLALT